MKLKSHHKALIDLIRKHVGEPETGAEIGVWKAETSEILARTFPRCMLTLVDPWREWQPGESYHDEHKRTGKLTAEEWEAAYAEARDRMNVVFRDSNFSPFSYRIIREQSAEAAAQVGDRSLDFVFIDANHTYESVKSDIELWLPKVTKLICGHDYGSVRDRRGRGWGVSRAVHEAFGEENVIVAGGRVWGVVL